MTDLDILYEVNIDDGIELNKFILIYSSIASILPILQIFSML